MDNRSFFWINHPCFCHLPHGIRIRVETASHQRFPEDSWKHFKKIDAHQHKALHIIILTAGRNALFLNGEDVEWSTPQGILIDSNVIHNVRPIYEGAIEYLQLTFSVLDKNGEPTIQTWSELSQSLGGRSIDNRSIRTPIWQRAIPDLSAAVNAVVEKDALSLSARLLALIAGLSAGTKEELPTELQYLREQISQEPDRDWDLSSLAETCGWSVGYLHRRCRVMLERTPMELVYQIRLEKANSLLLDGSLSMDSIAEKCGFSDAYHFSKRFKGYYGMPPGTWRKRNML